MRYQIEKNVPPPGPEFPFADMEPGDSFLIPFEEGENGSSPRIRNICAEITMELMKGGQNATNMYVRRNVEGGIRFWRV